MHRPPSTMEPSPSQGFLPNPKVTTTWGHAEDHQIAVTERSNETWKVRIMSTDEARTKEDTTTTSRVTETTTHSTASETADGKRKSIDRADDEALGFAFARGHSCVEAPVKKKKDDYKKQWLKSRAQRSRVGDDYQAQLPACDSFKHAKSASD